jgi:hypothetical protein
MQQVKLALSKSIESKDTDLIYLTILHMKRKMPLADFFRMIKGKPLACSLFEIYARDQDESLLSDYYYQDNQRISTADLIFESSYKEKSFDGRITQIKEALKIYKEDKETIIDAKVYAMAYID